jgi:hypothetical protein
MAARASAWWSRSVLPGILLKDSRLRVAAGAFLPSRACGGDQLRRADGPFRAPTPRQAAALEAFAIPRTLESGIRALQDRLPDDVPGASLSAVMDLLDAGAIEQLDRASAGLSRRTFAGDSRSDSFRMSFRPVERVRTMSRLEFAAYMRHPEAPVVITDAMDDWPAMKRWSLDFFADRFPDYPVQAHAPQFAEFAICSVTTTLARYIDYLRDPSCGHIEGTWNKGDRATLLRSGLTLYAGNFNPAHPICGNRDLVFEDVPALPDFVECWRCLLDPAFNRECEAVQSHYYVYLSAPGAMTPLHDDFWSTHAFLAQIVGRKEAFLFAPGDVCRLYGRCAGDVRAMMQDPQCADIEGWRATLCPGEMLVLPAKWLHYVETLEPSITYSVDWIDAGNWRNYLAQAVQAVEQRRSCKQ